MAGSGSGHGDSSKAILAAFLANMGIAIAKFVGFATTGSSALLAESIHSVADSSNQGLLFLGGRRARKAPTELHQFGYGRSRYFWAFMVSVVLFGVGGLFSLWEGIHKVGHPEEIDSPIVAFVIFGLAIVFEALALRTATRHANSERDGRSWIAYIRTSRSPELPVLVLEDSGAVVGLTFATIGVALAQITGNPVWDGVGTIAIGVLLVAIAIVLAVEMSSLLLGESARPEQTQRIESELAATAGVRSIIHVLTQHLGPDELLVAVKLEFEPDLTVPQLASAINDCEQRVRAAVPIAKRIYIEPDLRGATEADAADSE
jgi:cation diffusion facilitator family transporter